MALLRIVGICLGLSAASFLHAQSRDLQIIWNDVEGGGATLIVTPSGQSLLVDAGWAQDNGRDAKRIVAAAKTAGVSKIDILVSTHFHTDHVGGTPGLAQMIPIGKFYDHGDSIEASTGPGAALYNAYKATAEGKRVTVKPGDTIPLEGVDITAVSAGGEVIGKAINGGGRPNEFCKDAQQKDTDKTENGQSVGFLLTYGKFKFLDLGDLTWDREMMLACPANKLGTVTLFQASHHGFSGGLSGSPAFVWALKPQVVVVNDGARKGFDAAAYDIMTKIPGVEAIWQVHRAVRSETSQNTAPDMIANLEEGNPDMGFGIKVTVAKDGKFTVTDLRNNFSKTYTAK